MNMNCVFRVDASFQMGSGHVMRCLTLAQELTNRGAECCFICRDFQGNLISLIEEKKFEVYSLPIEPPDPAIPMDLAHSSWMETDWNTDANAVSTILKEQNSIDWLIIDHYAIDHRWEEQMRPFVKNIMVIDDLADRSHDCDILLDQNFLLNSTDRYNSLVPQTCKLLLGTDYALLKPDYAKLRERLPYREGTIQRLLIFFGGSDPDNLTERSLRALQSIGCSELEIDVVIGATNPHRIEIESLCNKLPQVELHYSFIMRC